MSNAKQLDHIDLLLKQAKTAVQQKNQAQARRLLQQAVRQDPQDYRGWLWLASVAPTPQASLEYVNRADMLAPNNATVQKARRWAEKRLSHTEQMAPETITIPAQERKSRWPQLARWLAIALVVLLLGAGGVFAWQYFQPATEPMADTAVLTSSLSPSNDIELASSEVEAAPAKATATQTPQPYVPAKQIASTGSDQPRPTWTVTPTPSPTPTPTPTVIPTFVNPNYQDAVRPFGVGPNERWIDVNLSTQTLRAYEGDNVVFSTLISSGTWEHPTVTGQFRIWLEYESQTMDGRLLGYDYYLENVPYVMYFYQDYALHGTFWHNNFGTPMSHGCVNMETNDAAWIYNFATIGTLVNVHY
ncbi:L,D-transpeptidase family protein [Candidatus Leptofilum sp.]|uniref:L,D-transpeptidase family protein n=1 Tax=Candidatus Leptofilum sp. TaxID=3241576 RepID=UPI003B58F81E